MISPFTGEGANYGKAARTAIDMAVDGYWVGVRGFDPPLDGYWIMST